MANGTGGTRGPGKASGEPKIVGMTHQPSTATKALIRQHVKGGKNSGPDKATPQQARAAVRAAQIVAPGLTLGQLNQNVNAATGLKYGQVESNIRNQPARISDWYGQYQQAIKDAQAQQQAGYAAADQNLGALQTGLNTASKDQWAGQQAAMASDAASRGATVDPALADQAKNASLTRSDVTAGLRGLIAGQGTVAKTGLVNRGVTAGQQKGEALSANHAALVALLADKGNFRQQYRDTAISDASKTALNNALTASQLGQSAATTAKTQADTANTKAQTSYFEKYGRLPSSTDPNLPSTKLDNARLDYFNKHGYFPPTGPPKPPKNANPTGKDQFGNTKKDRERNVNNWTRSVSVAKQISGPKDTVQSLTQLIVFKYPTIPPWMATAAAEQVILNHVGPNSARKLVHHGVKNGFARQAPSGANGAAPTAPGPGGTSARPT